jgi:glycosyltransferase involved in cell wall biosynthesis
MLSVLHCIYDDPRNPWVGGGGAVRVFELYRRLRGDVNATVLTGSFPGSRDEILDGVRYRRVGAAAPYPLSRLTYAAAATRSLRRGGYDAAIFDFSTYTPLRVPRDQPVGVTVHHTSGAAARHRFGAAVGRILLLAEQRTLRRARFLSATSAATYDELRSRVRPDARILRVGAGVPDTLFELQRNEAAYVLYFGRLDWEHKGLDVLLDAFRILRRGRADLRLKVAGRGRDAPKLERAVRDMGLAGSVDVLGAVSDAGRDRLFRGALLLLMPSRFEGFGLAAAEAMAAGVPVVASAAGSLPEVLNAPHGGIVAPVGDAVALADAAGRLLRDDAARTALSHAARREARRFRWEDVAQQHLAFIRAIHKGGPDGS